MSSCANTPGSGCPFVPYTADIPSLCCLWYPGAAWGGGGVGRGGDGGLWAGRDMPGPGGCGAPASPWYTPPDGAGLACLPHQAVLAVFHRVAGAGAGLPAQAVMSRSGRDSSVECCWPLKLAELLTS